MKIKLRIEEKVTYHSEIVADFPNNMSEDDINRLLDEVERKCADGPASDVPYVLKKLNPDIFIMEINSGFPDCPEESELEIYDYYVIDEQ